ncbi:MAG: transposase, partial [Sphingomonadales bacterium]
RRKRRSWSDDEKREICQQTTLPGVSIAQVARRYATNANQIHNWLRDERFAPAPEVEVEPERSFVEVDIAACASPGSIHPVPTVPSPGALITATRVDLTLSDGRRILIEGPMALSAIVGLVEGLGS